MTLWLPLACLSAAFLGFYDIFKKRSLKDNPVLPVLFLNTVFSSLIFLPLLLLSREGLLLPTNLLYVGTTDLKTQLFIALKAVIVLCSWFFGYVGVKHLPLSLVGPMQATRPVLVLVGAVAVFGESLNLLQWLGVSCAVFSLYLMGRTGRSEGIEFRHNLWVWAVAAAIFFGAISGLYDKFLMSPTSGLGLDRMAVQTFFNFYQAALMGLMYLIFWWPHRRESPFRWTWCILGISLFLSLADFAYLYALGQDGALISLISMIRRGSVLVSFTFAALVLKEKKLREKAFDLGLVFLSMALIYWGTQGA